MMFSRLFRPAIRQISVAANSTQCLNRVITPVTSTLNKTRVGDVDDRFQSRGYRRTIDVSHLKPLNFDYSEDLVQLEPLDPNDILFKYRTIPEITGLPENVKKLFTVEYASSREKIEHRNAVLLDKVSGLVGPGPCLEKEICYLTMKIRNLKPHVVRDRRNKKHKSYLIERIAKRKKLLKTLRRMDYDRFLWLLKELKVTFSFEDPYTYRKYCRTSRTSRRKREVWVEAMNEKKRKMEEVKAELEKEKQQFLKMKEEILEQIDKDIKEFGLDKADIVYKFGKRMKQKRDENIQKAKKLTKLEKYKQEMAEKKERESRVF